MAERGYEGVTMRELSKRSGISTRTLYEMYGNKDSLLGQAFRNRLDIVFERWDEGISAKGLDHLIQLNAAIVASILGSENFSRAYASVLASAKISIYSIETPVVYFRRCLDEIAAEGGFQPWSDLDLTARRLLMSQNSLMIQWGNGTISGGNLEALYHLSLCETLLPLATGALDASLRSQFRMLHDRFVGTVVF